MASKKTQIGKFKQAARELETDDDEKSFQREAGQHRQAEARRETGEAQAQIALFSEHWSSSPCTLDRLDGRVAVTAVALQLTNDPPQRGGIPFIN